MAEPRKKWFKLTGMGCGLLVLLVLVLIGATMRSVSKQYGEALTAREFLDEEYGSSAEFTPERSGGIHPDRLRRFCAVRRILLPLCETVTRHQRAFQRVEDHANEENPAPGDLLEDAGRAARSLFSIGDDFGNYIVTRNRALEDYEIGLGEYTWIYVMAYYVWEGHEPVGILPGESRPSVLEARVIPELREMVRRHIPAIEKSLRNPKPEDRPRLEQALANWTRELEALERDDGRIPFQNRDGLPPELYESLRSFQTQINRAGCPQAGELDLVRTEKTGFWYDHR